MSLYLYIHTLNKKGVHLLWSKAAISLFSSIHSMHEHEKPNNSDVSRCVNLILSMCSLFCQHYGPRKNRMYEKFGIRGRHVVFFRHVFFFPTLPFTPRIKTLETVLSADGDVFGSRMKDFIIWIYCSFNNKYFWRKIGTKNDILANWWTCLQDVYDTIAFEATCLKSDFRWLWTTYIG